MSHSLLKKCQEAGLKVTEQRKTILKVLDESADHPSVEMVYDRAKELDSSVSMATVYRTLNLLDELNLVIRHDFKENYSRYEIKDRDHYHLINLEDGKVVEFEDKAMEELVKKIAKEHGFEMIDHRLEIYGKKIK